MGFLKSTQIILAFFAFVFISKVAQSQTNPTPQSLPYTQSFGALVSTSTVYPVGLQGWNLSTSGSSSAFRTISPPASSDLPLQASSTAATNTGGIHNYNGKIGFLGSGTVDPALCLAINTSGYFSVSVAFDVMTIRNPFDVTNTRINQVDLQYRVGTTGAFTSVTAISNGLYQNNTTNQITAVTTPQNQLAKLFTLPAACNNQAIVQLRWVQRDFTGVNLRPGFAIDNISICSSQVTPTISISGPASFCSGGSATYTSTITNGGTTPTYQWKKNGGNVATGSVATLSGLIIGDQITCVLTSNVSCASALTATSNSILISSINSSPIINANSISNVSCPGINDGAIDISVSGGTGPYTISWDTVNITNGPVFGVSVGPKAPTHPLFGQGNVNTFVIDGVGGKELFLTKGISYSFSVLTPTHPFQISTDLTGGNANFIVSNGQTGAPTQNGIVTFTPNNSHPSLLYYPCQFHTFMGYRVNITNGFLSEDVSNLRAGTYTVSVTDANGCTATAQYTISELPSPVSLSANVQNSTCGLSNGSIDLSITGGVGPYSVIWDTLNTANGASFGVSFGTKTPSNPYFGLGSLSCFFIDGFEMPQLNLVKGIDYTFNVLSAGHPFHISTDNIGGNSTNLYSLGQSNAPSDNGAILFSPPISAPSQLYYICSNHQYMGNDVNISGGYEIEDPVALHQGIYSVHVVDANGCTANATFTIGDDGSPVSNSINGQTSASCYGIADGAVDIEPTGGIAPYTVVGTGPVFSVIAEVKNQSHPQFGLGSRPEGFTINGIQGMELTLIRGITYSFAVMAPTHAFFISTSSIGGPLNLASEVTDGVVNSMISSGTLFFTPNVNHPSLLYYQCGAHDFMGWKINIVDQGSDGDQTALIAGDYSLSVVDATGCVANSPVLFTISEPSALSFYLDEDGDGYGTNNVTALGCNPPSGFTALDGDCLDNDATINPGAVEVCDLIDNNCNGFTDDSDPLSVATRWFADSDIDGFGDINDIGIISCVQPLMTVDNNVDCDDANASINPGAIESCNLIDDDCDGLVDDSVNCFTELTLNLFLQGFYIGGSELLAVLDPDTHPLICDSVRVDLAEQNFPYDVSYTSTSVINTSGVGIFTFPLGSKGNSYYLIIHHRNSLETWSSIPIEAANQFTYNFTSAQSQAFGGNLVEVETGIFALWSGDVNQDGFIDDADLISVETGTTAFGFGYFVDDLTGDWMIESSDYSLIENNSVVLPFTIRP